MRYDLENLTDKELLEEFADRYLAYEESQSKTLMWKLDHGYSDDSSLDYEHSEEYQNLMMEEDEKFCLLRECVRFVKKDNTLLQC
jgi:hypothetical protein